MRSPAPPFRKGRAIRCVETKKSQSGLTKTGPPGQKLVIHVLRETIPVSPASQNPEKAGLALKLPRRLP